MVLQQTFGTNSIDFKTPKKSSRFGNRTVVHSPSKQSSSHTQKRQQLTSPNYTRSSLKTQSQSNSTESEGEEEFEESSDVQQVVQKQPAKSKVPETVTEKFAYCSQGLDSISKIFNEINIEDLKKRNKELNVQHLKISTDEVQRTKLTKENKQTSRKLELEIGVFGDAIEDLKNKTDKLSKSIEELTKKHKEVEKEFKPITVVIENKAQPTVGKINNLSGHIAIGAAAGVVAAVVMYSFYEFPYWATLFSVGTIAFVVLKTDLVKSVTQSLS